MLDKVTKLKFMKAVELPFEEIEKYQVFKKEDERLFQEGFQKIVEELSSYIYETTERKPIILPIIMNIKKETNQTN